MQPPSIGVGLRCRKHLTRNGESVNSFAPPLCDIDRLHIKRIVWNTAVIRSFGDRTTADLFREADTRAARRIPNEVWRVARRKLKMLDVALAPDDLRIPAGNRLERLKGSQRGRYSIRINDQYRLTFRWEEGNAYEVSVEDYH